jgi:hypothetical protein
MLECPHMACRIDLDYNTRKLEYIAKATND